MVLPPPWDAYLRLQASLDDSTGVNNRSWGLEAVLDAILARAAVVAKLPTTIATAERRERHRARLRRTYPSALWPVVDQPGAIEARVELAQIRTHLPALDWQLISSFAMGIDYQTIGRIAGMTPGNLRIRTMRVRQTLLARLAA
jgi:hypothetical protein